MLNKKIIKLISVLLLCVKCSSISPNSRTPSNYNENFEDAGITVIDLDVYQQTQPDSLEPRPMNLNPTNGELITPLRESERAPFQGVLFNGQAAARIEVEFTGLQRQCSIDRTYDLNRLRAVALRDITTLQTTLQTDRRLYQTILNSRNNEINFLYSSQQTQPNILYLAAGGVGFLTLGFGIGIVTGLLVAR